MKRIGRVLVLAAALAPSHPAAAADVKEVRRTVDLAGSGRLSIDTFKGWIEISTWDRPQAEIVARIEPDDHDFDRGQAEKVRQTEVRIDGSVLNVRIRSDYDRVRSRHFWGLFAGRGALPLVRYAIRMPRTASLEIKDYKSRTRIAGLAAALELKTYKGDVEILEMDGPVRLETYKGEVRAEYARYAPSEFDTHKGNIEIAMPRQTAFSLDANLGRHGDLRSDFGVAERTAGRRREHRVRDAAVNGGGPRLALRTYNGEFRIRAR